MKKFIGVFFLFIFYNSQLHAQAIVYQKTFGGILNDYGFDVTSTVDGGYALAGYTNGFGSGNDDVLLIKLDSNSQPKWSKTYGGAGNDQAAKIVRTNDGGFVMLGTTTSYGAGATDVLLIKTDSDGAFQWMKVYGGNLDERAYNFRETADHGFILACSTLSYGQGNWDMLFIKTNSVGDTLWTKILGGSNSDQGTDAMETSNGDFIFLGRTESFGSGMSDAFIAKANNLGDTLWTRVFGSPLLDEGMKVKQTTDGGYIVTGSSTGFSNGTFDAYLNKLDSNGVLVWSKIYAGLSTDATYDVLQLDDGGYIISGETESFGNNHAKIINNDLNEDAGNNQPGNHVFGTNHSNILVIRTDVNGDTLWSRAYGGNLQDEGYSIIKTPDKGFMLLSYAKSFSADSMYDFYLIKTDSTGYSGCYDELVFPDVISPATIAGNTSIQIGSGVNVFSTSVIGSVVSAIENTLCLTTNVDESSSEPLISIYPNPSTTEVSVMLPESLLNFESVEINIIDVSGKFVKRISQPSINKIQFAVSDIKGGMYFLDIELSDRDKNAKRFFHSKIIVQ